MYGVVERMEDAETEKKVVKNYLALLVVNINFCNSLAVITTQLQSVKMVWFLHGEEAYLVNLGMEILRIVRFLLLLNLS